MRQQRRRRWRLGDGNAAGGCDADAEGRGGVLLPPPARPGRDGQQPPLQSGRGRAERCVRVRAEEDESEVPRTSLQLVEYQNIAFSEPFSYPLPFMIR